MVDLRFQWEANFAPKGDRGSAARRASSVSIARTRRSSGGRGVSALKGLLRTIAPVIPKVVAEAELAILQEIHKSDWPVDTGFSIASFFWIGNGDKATLANKAPYAQVIEDRTSILKRIVVNDQIALMQRIDDEIGNV